MTLWLGPVEAEARAAYQRAREAGLSPLRALVIGSVASFRDCWAFRKKLAERARCSVRTVQRALTQARAEGLIGVARAKPNEHPPNWDRPVECGWSHRWTIGWGKAGAEVRDAIARAKARWIVHHAVAPGVSPSGGHQSSESVPPPGRRHHAPTGAAGRPGVDTGRKARRWTAAELDAELERLARTGEMPGPIFDP